MVGTMAKIDDSVKKKVPELRFPGFTDDWEERKLEDIFLYKQGQQVPVENQFTKPGKHRHRFIRIVDLTTTDEEPRYIEYSGHNTISATDLFMIRYGQPGVIGYGYEGVIANNLFKLIPKVKANNRFFKYRLDSMYPKIQSLSSSTTMPAISFKSLDVLDVRYPDIKEQEKIGAFFKQLDGTIALHQRKLDLLKEQKKGYLQKMFPKNGAKVPELRFAGFADDWEERKLGELGKVTTGKAFSSIDFDEQGEYLVITNKDISNSSRSQNVITDRINISDKDIVEKYNLSGENILVTMDGVNLGKTAMYSNEDALLAQRVGRIQSTQLEFIYQITSSSSFLMAMRTLSVGNAIKHISLTQISNYSTLVPSNKNEQQKIGSFFKQLDDTIDLHQRKLDLLKEQKKGFLQKMFV